MGNDESKHRSHSDEKKKYVGASEASCSTDEGRRDPRLDAAFAKLAQNSDEIGYKRLEELFDEDLADSFWKYFAGSKPHTEGVTRYEFFAKAPPLFGTSTDIYVKICQPVHHFVKVCSDAADAQAIQGDEEFIKCLVKEMTSAGSSSEQIAEWKRADCPKFCHAVQAKFATQCLDYPTTKVDYSSDILTPMQMWYLQCCLPNVYFQSKEPNIQNWTPLYTSLQHGISTNRFETLVFDYRGPTVTIFRLNDKRVVALATDQEWRHGSSRFGGTSTCFFEILPNLQRIDAASSIYCNLKIRSAAFGISFKDIMKIDKDFNEVLDIEVWGCAGANTLAEQQKLKNWQKQQAEKHKKVPLPGNWDDNPDKSILEMAGFQFSNERQNMEMEARRRLEQ